MKVSAKNYISQVAIEKNRRRAFLVWSVSTFIIFGWILLILLAPFAEARSLENVSNPLYNFFGYFCHQIPARSVHLENHVFAVCSRCFGVYFGLLSGFAAYPFFRSAENVESLSRFWLFAAMIPMASFALSERLDFGCGLRCFPRSRSCRTCRIIFRQRTDEKTGAPIIFLSSKRLLQKCFVD
jgi:hypothetical protein